MKYHSCLFFFLWALSSYGQYIVSGYVFFDDTQEPVYGAEVFYDGTSIGTLSDEKGYFALESSKPLNTAIVIRYLGYNTVYLEPSETTKYKVYLIENAIALEQVDLEPDTWSRKKKERVFKREFLGDAYRCKILNVNDIRFYYKGSERTLFAYADKPIKIINYGLGYEITYSLKDFWVTFVDDSDLSTSVSSVFYAGGSQFTELAKEPKNRVLRKRSKAYSGSLTHFFKSLYNKELNKEQFTLYHRSLPIAVDAAFSIKQHQDYIAVHQKYEKITTLHQNQQSFIKLVSNPYSVDSYGVFYPPERILVGGFMGKKRLSSLLPLDFEPDSSY